MQISTKEHARLTVVVPTGRIDHDTYGQLTDVLDGLILARKYNIVVDLSGVDYVSSAGLRALLRAHKELQSKGHGDVRLAAPQAAVAETLRLVGFQNIFKIYTDLVDAVGSY